jgi:hypothetical protein
MSVTSAPDKNPALRTYRLLNVCVAEARGEHGLGLGAGERLRDGDDIRAVNHLARVLAEHRHLRHRGLEGRRHVRLVVHVRLPEACRARVLCRGLSAHLKVSVPKDNTHTSQLRVTLQADLAGQRRLDLALVCAISWEERAAQLRLDEELCVKERRRRVERCAGDRWVNVVRRGNRVPIIQAV